MKIGIVTLYGFFNHGNRLQNYALQHVLEECGHTVETLAVEQKKNPVKSFIKKYLERGQNGFVLIPAVERRREKNFKRFSEQNIPVRYMVTADGKFPDTIGQEYDALVVGSDQVWNPSFWEDSDTCSDLYNFLLQFACKKKVAYAASFGIEQLPEQWEKRMVPSMREFDAISVRETAGKELLKQFDIPSEVVLDPTMLVKAEDWRKVESHVVAPDKNYILLYFLGEQPDHVKTMIQDKAAELGAEIVDLMDEKSTYFYEKGPDTFLETIDKAEIVFTDSFHASVFSLIFHTSFVVLGRLHNNGTNMNSRIETLLHTVGIKDGISTDHAIVHQDFNNTDQLLAAAREKSLELLKSMLG